MLASGKQYGSRLLREKLVRKHYRLSNSSQRRTLAVSCSPGLLLSRANRCCRTLLLQRNFSQLTLSCKNPDFNGSYTSTYTPLAATRGPLGRAKSPALDDQDNQGNSLSRGETQNNQYIPKITPRYLKKQLDEFVVGQERAKKVLSVAVFNHYQRINEVERKEKQLEEKWLAREREIVRERYLRPDEDAVHDPLISGDYHSGNPRIDRIGFEDFGDDDVPLISKSNILLFGPSGVGKTLMAKTLANILSVPFSISDCTPFTQAGYIGEDVETCVARLLSAANYDVEAAERGIIVLDELDKLAATRSMGGHGSGGGQKDVGGEGVQQALLKIIEGTTVQIQAKPEKSAPTPPPPPSGTILHPHQRHGDPRPPGAPSGQAFTNKAETYNVRTDNILFIISGAFVGLEKHVMDRLSRGSMGFGQPIRKRSNSGFGQYSPGKDENNSRKASIIEDENAGGLMPILPGSEEEQLYREHLPFFTTSDQSASSPDTPDFDHSRETTYFNPLDLVTPTDLQTYGMIPELIGRIPVTAALSPLSHSLLLRILTEPRNSLVKEYTSLFALSDVSLYFTVPALHAIASRALKHSADTGARSLRTTMENLLSNAMFEVPGSSVRHVVVTGASVRGEEGIMYFSRGNKGKAEDAIEEDERQWRASRQSINQTQGPDSESAKNVRRKERYQTRTHK